MSVKEDQSIDYTDEFKKIFDVVIKENSLEEKKKVIDSFRYAYENQTEYNDYTLDKIKDLLKKNFKDYDNTSNKEFNSKLLGYALRIGVIRLEEYVTDRNVGEQTDPKKLKEYFKYLGSCLDKAGIRPGEKPIKDYLKKLSTEFKTYLTEDKVSIVSKIANVFLKEQYASRRELKYETV